jgi:flavin reductase (DIM6/NTAB) family NADH-FMN oxidoreductase RutF
MTSEFVKVRVLDNFYQTSSFYPMPVILVTTIAEDGTTNIGPYSLVFPFGIADQHAMMLISRADSNTAKNIRRTKKAMLNFIPFDKKLLKNTVRLGYPGQSAEEKLNDSIFTLARSEPEIPNGPVPDIIEESVQVFDCSWDDSDTFHYKGTDEEFHFLLRIDRILMKKYWHQSLIEGNGKFPTLPVDYGYRDSQFFWFSEPKKPYKEPLPKGKGVNIDTIRYQADRIDPEVYWTDEACAKIVAIPRVFLKKAMTMIVEEAKKRGVTTLTPEILDEIRDKRNQEKRQA